MCVLSHSRHVDSATLQTVARQAPLSMGFSWQDYWSRVQFPPQGDLSNPWIKPRSPTMQVDPLLMSYQGSPLCSINNLQNEQISTVHSVLKQTCLYASISLLLIITSW